MDYLIKYKKIALPVLILLQSVLLTAVLVGQLKNSSESQKILQAVTCDYFTNVTEWQAGRENYISPNLSSENEQSALRGYREVINSWEGLCSEGLCLDSCRVQLFKSCPDVDTVQILKDTLIYY